MTRSNFSHTLGLLVFLAAFGITSTCEASDELYKVNAGPHEVIVVATFNLPDADRDKELPLRITFPREDGKYPLVIFSHGAMGSKDAYGPLVKHWASHGYVCVQPTHEDSLQLIRQSGERFRLRDVWAKWSTRPPDVQLILDSLDKLEKEVDGLEGKIDRERIGMGGHSFGAHTSQLIGGVKMRNPRTKRFHTLDDPRPAAFLLISPQGTGDSLTAESYSGLTRPTLVITGTNDKSSRTGKGYLWRKEVYDNAPAGDRYLLTIDEAHHGFGGITGARRFPGSGPANAEQVAQVQSASLAFWDFFLKEQADAGPWLRTGKFAAATDGEAKMATKYSR